MTAKMLFDSTIFAVSSGLGKSAIAVVRISGTQCNFLIHRLCKTTSFVDRQATLAFIYDIAGNIIDRAIVIRFLAPRSFTGEDMLEIHVTGGRAVIAGVLAGLSSCEGTRLAEAGEFAMRAYRNGKLDLLEIEGLASVVEAETSAQLRHAVLISNGDLSRVCEEARTLLLEATSIVESLLDFSDAEDSADYELRDVLNPVRKCQIKLASVVKHSSLSSRLHQGLRVVIAGPPNVGKSTLLNHLAGRDVAIVSDIPGTTRDNLEVQAEISGFPVVFVDTAGLRATADPLEAQGIDRSRRRIAEADLTLWLFENECDGATMEEGGACLRVRTKADIARGPPAELGALAVSAKTGSGVEEMIAEITRFAQSHFSGFDSVTVGSERQKAAIREALSALHRILEAPTAPLEGTAEDLRTALSAMGRVVGRVGVEDVLDEVFSRLCVGK